MGLRKGKEVAVSSFVRNPRSHAYAKPLRYYHYYPGEYPCFPRQSADMFTVVTELSFPEGCSHVE